MGAALGGGNFGDDTAAFFGQGRVGYDPKQRRQRLFKNEEIARIYEAQSLAAAKGGGAAEQAKAAAVAAGFEDAPKEKQPIAAPDFADAANKMNQQRLLMRGVSRGRKSFMGGGY